MPNKQTKRERKELAKKQRLEQIRRATRRRRMRKLTTITTVALAVALVAGFIVWNSARNKDKEQKANARINAAAAILTGDTAKSDWLVSPVDQLPVGNSPQHLQAPATFPYNSNPPTSGNHYGQWADMGVYDAEIPDETQVHNLEHGHVVIQYNPTTIPAAVKTALEAFTNKDKTWVLMAPRTQKGFTDALAFTAWGRLVSLPTVKDDAAQATAIAQAFYDRFKDESPRESVPGTPKKT